MIREEMERIYGLTPPADIPWNIETPPRVLVELVERGQVQPCKAIEFGCGAGNYAIYLANVGFDMTGVDLSTAAIAIAETKAKETGAACRFMAADVLGGLAGITETFDFAYDWSLLHHIFPDKRRQYVETVHRMLASGGQYLSVCFSDRDAGFGGRGKQRETSLGTVLYFSSEKELRELFAPFFDVVRLDTMPIEGKAEPHLMNYVFMTRR